MDDQRLQVKEVADRLGVSTPSIRRYSDRYAEQLSSYASGRPRTFTEQDVARLSVAVRMTALREDQDAIIDAIKDLRTGDVDSPGEALLVRGDDLPTVTRAYVDQTVAQSVDARFAQQLADQRITTAVVTGVIVGVIITMVFVAVLLWIVGV